MTVIICLYCCLSDQHILCQLHIRYYICQKKNFYQQWLKLDRLKPNHLFQETLESHNFWSISDTDNVVELCSEVWFQEYTENSPHEPYLDDKQVTTT